MKTDRKIASTFSLTRNATISITLTPYNIDEIVTLMKKLYPDYVDGFNTLDIEALTSEAWKELRASNDNAQHVPTEFLLAGKQVMNWHKEQ